MKLVFQRDRLQIIFSLFLLRNFSKFTFFLSFLIPYYSSSFSPYTSSSTFSIPYHILPFLSILISCFHLPFLNVAFSLYSPAHGCSLVSEKARGKMHKLKTAKLNALPIRESSNFLQAVKVGGKGKDSP